MPFGDRHVLESGHVGDHSAIEIASVAETAAREAADLLLIPFAQKGANSGIAPLDPGGKVPSINSRVQSVAGRIGAVVLTASDISGVPTGADIAAETVARIAADSAHATGSAAHAASNITFIPPLSLTATDVQAGINESEVTAAGIANSHPKLVSNQLVFDWTAVLGIDSTGVPYFDTAGATPGEEASVVFNELGQARLVQADFNNPGMLETSAGAQARVDLETARAVAAEMALGLVPGQTSNDLSAFNTFYPEKYGTVTGDATTAVRAALAAAIVAGGTLRFMEGKTYTTDYLTVNGACSVYIPANATVKLKNSATEASNVLTVFNVTASNVSIVGSGTVDFNRANQDKTGFNAAGGGNAKSWFGIRVIGSAGTHLAGITVDARVINSSDHSLYVQYCDSSRFDTRTETSGAGPSFVDCTDLALPTTHLLSLDNDGWKVFPHAFDMFGVTDTAIGYVHNKGQAGTGSTGAGTALSNWVSGVTWVACSRINYGSIFEYASQAPAQTKSVGVSFLDCTEINGNSTTIIGYTDNSFEIGGVVQSHFTNVHIDGQYKASLTGTGTVGMALYNNGYYRDFSSRSIRFTEDCSFTNVNIQGCNNEGLYLVAARRCSFVNLRSNGNKDGAYIQYSPTDAVFTGGIVRDLKSNTFTDCDFSYNENHGVRCLDLRDSTFIGCRATNNGQAVTFGATRSGVAVTSSATGWLFSNSAIGAPLSKTGLRFIAVRGDDTQTWTSFVSPDPSAPTILSVENDELYHLGQTVTFIGAGTSGSSLTGQIKAISQDEITLNTPFVTLTQVAGTGTISTTGTALTGVGTILSTEVPGRYNIGANGQNRRIVQVASNTSATLLTAFSPDLPPGTSFTIYKTPSSALPSQNTGIVLATDAISPTLIGCDFSGNITTNVSDATVIATAARLIAVPGKVNNFQNSITTVNNVTAGLAPGSTDTHAALGNLGPALEACIQFGDEAATTLYRAVAGRFRTPGTIVADTGFGVGNNVATNVLGAVVGSTQVVNSTGSVLGSVPILSTTSPMQKFTSSGSLSSTTTLFFSNGSNLAHVVTSASARGAGFQVVLKNLHTTSCTFTSGGGNIAGVSTLTLPANAAATLASDGTDWWII